jgi:hypothetical protein
MVFVRTVLVALIAVSVAALPAAPAVMMSRVAAEMPMTDRAGTPCCPDQRDQNLAKATACVLKCASLAAVMLPAPTIAAPGVRAAVPLTVVHEALRGLLRAPPTHPPPV